MNKHLNRDMSMTYLVPSGEHSHRRADSFRRFNVGRVLVLINPHAWWKSAPRDLSAASMVATSASVYCTVRCSVTLFRTLRKAPAYRGPAWVG